MNVVGTKYVDYCADGKEIHSFPGDPTIDANLDKPDAPTPKCPGGMTWDHTSGMDAFDTVTGELEIGYYAELQDGTFAMHLPASIFKDATSSVELPERTVITKVAPVALPAYETPDTSPTQDATTTVESSASTSTEE